jgi:organic hydroperoxide reductase OsmC/OhrA
MSTGILALPRSATPCDAPTATLPDSRDFCLTIWSCDGYAQVVDFKLTGVPLLGVDEPPPLGKGRGPNPALLLGTAVGSCLASSFLFCLSRARIQLQELRTTVRGTVARNSEGRLRIGSINVTLSPSVADEDRARVERCRAIFEDFCIVTQSVRAGIDITVGVDEEWQPSAG